MDVKGYVSKVDEMEPTFGEWSAWSPWALWNLDILGGFRFVSSRTRTVTNHTRVTTQDVSCKLQCPLDYRPIGAGCELALPEPPNHPSGLPEYTFPQHPSTFLNSVTRTQDYPWTQIEFRSRVVDILKSVFTPGGHVPSLGGRTRKVLVPSAPVPKLAVAGKGGGKMRKLTIATLPALCEGDSFAMSRGPANFKMTVNGIEQSPSRPLVATDLGVGFHLIEVEGSHPETGKKVKLQLPLSVVSPIELKFPPVTKMTLKGKKNGGIVKLSLHNRSRGEYLVRVDSESVPVGWQAFRLGKAMFVIKAGKSAKVGIQVERKVVSDLTREPLSFSVCVSFPGTKISTARAMFYVVAREEFGKGRHPKRPKLTVF